MDAQDITVGELDLLELGHVELVDDRLALPLDAADTGRNAAVSCETSLASSEEWQR